MAETKQPEEGPQAVKAGEGSAKGVEETAVLPNLDHFTFRDFEKFYEPSEDSYLFLDALLKEKEYLRALNPSIGLEIG